MIEYSPFGKCLTRNSALERDAGSATILVPIPGGADWRPHSFPRPLLMMLTLKPGGPPKSGLQRLRVLRGVADVSARKERVRDITAESMTKIRRNWVYQVNAKGKMAEV